MPDREQNPGSFDERLKAARDRQDALSPAKQASKAMSSSMSKSMGVGLRVGVEFVSAVAIGLGIGWVLDRWLHTTPLFLVVFVLLGGAGGLLNVWRMMGPQRPPPS